MILVLGLWGGGAADSHSPPSPAGGEGAGGGPAAGPAAEDDCNDWGLVQGAMQVYTHCVARDADERAAYHSSRSLQQLLQTRSLAAQPDDGGGAAGDVEFTIPFFSDALLAADGNPFCALGIMPPSSPLNDMILGSMVSAPRTLQAAEVGLVAVGRRDVFACWRGEVGSIRHGHFRHRPWVSQWILILMLSLDTRATLDDKIFMRRARRILLT